MAESSRVGSYKCEFIDDVPEHLICGLCKHAANGPNITTCCGELFCQACIAPIVEEKQPCPSCEKPTFSAFLNPKYERSIKNLRVHCTMKDRGCQWTGKLEQLEAHLDVETGVCEYVDVECPEKCGQQIQKHQLATHVANECPERDFVCMYCGFKATYDIVSNKHWPECQNYPVKCPNECNIGAVERSFIEDHLNTCPLQVVECTFSYAGCNKKLPRQDMEKHVEESTREHLTLMAAASVKMSREFEKKLQEQRDEFRGYLEQKEKETAEQFKQKDRELKHFQESFQETQKALQIANEKQQQLEAQIVDLRNQTEMRDKAIQRNLEQQIQVLGEQLQQKKMEIQNLQQADERLRENLQRNERETKDKEKQLQEQLQVKHDQAKQQIVAVEKQLSKELQAKLKENEQQVDQKLKREVQQLQKQHEELKTKQDRQTQAADVKITAIKRQTEEKTTQIEKRVHRCENYNLPLIVIDNFKLQERRGIWRSFSHRSQCMYTHSGGYKFRFVISVQRTHVSVKLEAHRGPFDGCLQWPAKCIITLQLLNQHRDQDHVTVTKKLEWEQPNDMQRSQPLFLMMAGSSMEHREPVTVPISDTFIACDDLKWNAERQTQYLKNDGLHFRIV